LVEAGRGHRSSFLGGYHSTASTRSTAVKSGWADDNTVYGQHDTANFAIEGRSWTLQYDGNGGYAKMETLKHDEHTVSESTMALYDNFLYGITSSDNTTMLYGKPGVKGEGGWSWNEGTGCGANAGKAGTNGTNGIVILIWLFE